MELKPVADLHTHTIASSHAYSTIQENARAAREKGLLAVAITDHGPGMPTAPHPFYFGNLVSLPKVVEGIRLISGVEANITDNRGTLDLPERYLKRLEIVLAGLHVECIASSTVEENTAAVIGALNNPLVRVLVHAGNPQYPLDYDRVVEAAAKKGKIIEINNASFIRARSGSRKNCIQIARLCKKHGVIVAANSDAHFSAHVGELDEALQIIQDAGIPPENVVNLSMNRVYAALRPDNWGRHE